jgi:hypothetical protein
MEVEDRLAGEIATENTAQLVDWMSMITLSVSLKCFFCRDGQVE